MMSRISPSIASIIHVVGSVGSVERTFLSQARKLKDFHAGGPEDVAELESVDAALRLLEAPELRGDVIEASFVEEFILRADRDS